MLLPLHSITQINGELQQSTLRQNILEYQKQKGSRSTSSFQSRVPLLSTLSRRRRNFEWRTMVNCFLICSMTYHIGWQNGREASGKKCVDSSQRGLVCKDSQGRRKILPPEMCSWGFMGTQTYLFDFQVVIALFLLLSPFLFNGPIKKK